MNVDLLWSGVILPTVSSESQTPSAGLKVQEMTHAVQKE